MSLFVRLLLLFVAIALLTVGGIYLVARDSIAGTPGTSAILDRTLAAALVEARYIYEREGKDGLRACFRRFQAGFPVEFWLLDANGIDVESGSFGVMNQRPGLLFRRRSEDGQYSIVARVPGQLLGELLRSNRGWWMLAALLLFCFVAARSISAPLQRLSSTADRFGQGDLGARTRDSRRDEIGELARSFDRMADRIQTLVENQQRLLREVSHEFRSPLTRIRLAVALGEDGGDPSLAFHRVSLETERLDSLVSGLLAVNRAESSAAAPSVKPLRIDTLAKALAERLEVEATEANCRIEVHAGQPVEALGVETLVEAALENVIRNAIRHSPAGQAVDLSLRQTGTLAVITVRDHGVGVAPEALPRLFEPFFRVQPASNRASGGYGLGLSITERAISLQGGSISARNANPGLEILIQLPAAN